MDIVVRGRHLDVSDRFREHVATKLSRADRFGVPMTHADVEVSFEPNPRQSDRAYEVELTCHGAGPVIRAEAHAQDKYAALDIALARLEERLRRAADKRRSRRVSKLVVVPAADITAVLDAPAEAAVEEEVDDDGTVWEQGPIVVRLKEYVGAPMTVAQAVESMELVGHDFYLFRDSESGSPSVVYHRRGYNYGLLRLESGTDG
ncbi:MAG: ribosome-associated translation inhibitor RaiA [Actinomycetota bacterium]|nr:ribosome-associated translation inhibitor RaiA [Actinomycetota bacterium]